MMLEIQVSGKSTSVTPCVVSNYPLGSRSLHIGQGILESLGLDNAPR